MAMTTRDVMRGMALAACLSAPALAAADDGTHIGAAVTAGLSGLGLDAGVNITDYVGVRATFATLSFSHNGDYSTSVEWNAQARLRQAGVLLDIYPFAGAFHVTAGAVDDQNKLSATAQPSATGTLTFNGVSYPTSELTSASAYVQWSKTVPYLGLGAGNLAGSAGFHFTVDAGVLFTGSPTANINVACAAGQSCPQLGPNVAAEQAKLQNNVHSLNLWPVLRIGVGYAF